MTLQTHEELEMLTLIRGLNAKLDEVLTNLRPPTFEPQPDAPDPAPSDEKPVTNRTPRMSKV